MGQRRSVAAWDDTWRIEMKRAFPGPRQLRVDVLVYFSFLFNSQVIVFVYSVHSSI